MMRCGGYLKRAGEMEHARITRGNSAGIYVSVNPNPKVFKILKIIESENTYVEVHYPNCMTFEGVKVMVFKGKIADRVRRLVEIDPHFDNTGKLAPIARFEPTACGRLLAMQIANTEIHE